MSITEKIRTAKLAEHCPRCFAPGVFLKSKSNANTHLQKHCNVTQTTKHKFSCLTKTCLKHSWICQDHVQENEPLLVAHYEELATLMEEPEEPPKNKGIRPRANTKPNHLGPDVDRKHPKLDGIFKSTTYMVPIERRRTSSRILSQMLRP